MTPEEIGERLARVDGAVPSVSGGGRWARATVDVPVAGWRDAVLAARDDAELDCDYMDWLSAVDELAEGFAVVAHLWSTRRRHGVLLRTRVPRAAATISSIVDLYPGAAWHERETFEMFGIDFPGNGDLKPLLLPPEFEGHPLRKEFVLATRVAKPWPGAKEPGESEHAATRRQPMRPPGVPDPNEWGPAAGTMPAAPARPERRPRPAAVPAGGDGQQQVASGPAGAARRRPAAGPAAGEGPSVPDREGPSASGSAGGGRPPAPGRADDGSQPNPGEA